MAFKASAYPHPSQVFTNTEYISICVPTFCRPFYLRKLLDTLREHADMKYEVIVYDDGSPEEFRDEVYQMAKQENFLFVCNNYYNTGLCTAANRSIALASSRYILFLNDDCFFVRPCLRDVANALSKDYIGVVSPCNDMGPMADSNVTDANGTRVAVSNFLGGGSSMGFRKDVWAEVGGWDERSTSGQSDNVFFHKILRAGYFKGVMEGPDRVKVGNFVYGDDYKATAKYMKFDCSIPKVFGLTDEQQVYLNHKRREACQVWVDGERTIENRHLFDDRENPQAGLNDMPYWHTYFNDMFGGKGTNHNPQDINWEVAKRHTHDRWKNYIAQDFRLEI